MTSYRKVPLVTGEIYHVFNRGIDGRITFPNIKEYSRAYQIMKYYQFSSPPLKLSVFLRISDSKRQELQESSWGEKLVSMMCYCLMPNHFHFMLRQEVDGGISKFSGNQRIYRIIQTGWGRNRPRFRLQLTLAAVGDKSQRRCSALLFFLRHGARHRQY